MNPPPLDADYLQSLKKQDSALITSLVNEHTNTLLSAALGLGFRGTDAEELVQETFVTFLKGIERFEGRSSVRTYLFGILYNKVLEKRRSHFREQAVDPIDEVFESRFGFAGIWTSFPKGPEEQAISKETAEMVQDCAQNLTEDQRMAFYLKEVDQETTESICNILDVTPTHLGVLLFRSRNKLRECIEKKWRKANDASKL